MTLRLLLRQLDLGCVVKDSAWSSILRRIQWKSKRPRACQLDQR